MWKAFARDSVGDDARSSFYQSLVCFKVLNA
ncbi:hypothetical protein FVER14953_21402 [Fusarium verticillioides]|nr:hypothetical protein FVER14953_21402 [Fusarium verticillioides]